LSGHSASPLWFCLPGILHQRPIPSSHYVREYRREDGKRIRNPQINQYIPRTSAPEDILHYAMTTYYVTTAWARPRRIHDGLRPKKSFLYPSFDLKSL
jgi:hypothetical protein